MKEEIKTRQATEEELEVISAVGNSIANSLKAGGNQAIAMNVLIYVALRLLIDAKLKPGAARADLIDTWVASLRQSFDQTIDENPELTHG